ncbi:MAG: hypothetical protein D6737_09660 [Chloroflexi bacterium]|nr:MAG: hypothetical protein D6737_09660 [Chloroflexota bacterium]
MTRLLPLPIFITVMILFLTIGLIRAQPHDDDGLDAFLAPSETCVLPCWQGIRPGETTMREAVAILRNHAWVESVNVDAGALIYGLGFVTWTWNGQQPDFISDEISSIAIEESLVSQIIISTNVRFGELWLLQYAPRLGQVNVRATQSEHAVMFMPGTSRVSSFVTCPLSSRAFWNAPVILRFSEPSNILLEPYRLPRWLAHTACDA